MNDHRSIYDIPFDQLSKEDQETYCAVMSYDPTEDQPDTSADIWFKGLMNEARRHRPILSPEQINQVLRKQPQVQTLMP